ncbi:hypothetical protein [Verminephrobacter eiseniae]|uniref:hypothetical protein n=1 Tax=Verminephrobacter eiseniae TaxID=364317 RepID=UPI002236FF53|nr:hypothetical protein [Verminephrobacter eiseniae]
MAFSLLFPRVDSSAPGNDGVAPCKTGGWRQSCHQCVDLTIEYLLLEQKHTPKMQSSGLIPVGMFGFESKMLWPAKKRKAAAWNPSYLASILLLQEI